MEVKNSNFTAFIDVLTPNTYIMVIMSDPTIRMFLFYFKFLIYISMYFIMFIFFIKKIYIYIFMRHCFHIKSIK